jgi:NAD(P)-dependent dehydrogenase (short-subunit alcohol dehydrogenase family)
MRLENKVAIITGAARGMGESAAVLFAQEGAKVAVVDLKEEDAQATVQTIRSQGGEAIAIGADITKTGDVERIVDDTVRELGLPNVLFNNAGVDTEGRRSFMEVAEADFDRTVEVNLKGTWLMMKHVAPKMIEAGGGAIVNCASIAPFIAVSTIGYSAAKAGVIAMTKVAAVELGRHKVRVNALCPGATQTPMAKVERAKMEARGMKTSSAVINRMSLFGRLAEPIEMARMALFLASDESSFATGAQFINDGGMTSMGLDLH